MESVHADFKRTSEKYKVTKNHPDYADKLRRALSEYDTLHCWSSKLYLINIDVVNE